eukprot:GFUD01019612.1.p1 GENE.GFUD01019612.1~~GFUD01019612.1.p1  ORF type:complete len:2021 (+),score=754.74 GFUD01019612.1:811-6063(+)
MDGQLEHADENNQINNTNSNELKGSTPKYCTEPEDSHEDEFQGEKREQSEMKDENYSYVTLPQETVIVPEIDQVSDLNKQKDLNVLKEKERQNESDSDLDKIQSEQNIYNIQTEKEEIDKFNSGIIPEVMTSDVKIHISDDDKVLNDSGELSVSFELSGDESVCIELTPTKDDQEFFDEKTCKLTKKKTQRNTNKTEAPQIIENIQETSHQDDTEQNSEDDINGSGKVNQILQVSFDKNESDYKLSDKELTDESLNTSGFDISSIINRLEDEDDMSTAEAENNPTELDKNEITPLSLKSKSPKKNKILTEEQENGKEKKISNKELKSKTKTGTEDKSKESDLVQVSDEVLLDKGEKETNKNKEKKKKKDSKKAENTKDNNVAGPDPKTLPKEKTLGTDDVKDGDLNKDVLKGENGRIENGFVYIDPKMPTNWYVMVKKRNDGIQVGKADSYFFTPCHTKLRSKSEIIKFVEGLLPSKPVKKPLPISEMPLREKLLKEDLALTRDVDPKIFGPNKANVDNETTDVNETSKSKGKQALDEDDNKLSEKAENKSVEKKEHDNTKETNLKTEKKEEVVNKTKKQTKKGDHIEDDKKEILVSEKKKEETSKMTKEDKTPCKKGKKELGVDKKQLLISDLLISDKNKEEITNESKEDKKPCKKGKKELGVDKKELLISEKNEEEITNASKEDKAEKKEEKATKTKKYAKKGDHIEDSKNKPIVPNKKKEESSNIKKEERLPVKKGKKELGLEKKKKTSLAKKGKTDKNENLKSKLEKKKQLLRKNVPVGKTPMEKDTGINRKKISADSKDDHVFKVPSLESFRSQKNKSTKLLSPPIPKTDETKEKINEEDISEETTDNTEQDHKLLSENKLISKESQEEDKSNVSEFDKLFETPQKNTDDSDQIDKETEKDNKTSEKITSSKRRSTRLSDGDEISVDSGDDANTSDSDGLSSDKLVDDVGPGVKKTRRSSDVSDTEEIEDRSKKSKKLVKTRKTKNSEESSDDDLSPTRKSKPKSETKVRKKNETSIDSIGSDNSSSPDIIEKRSLKRKTRSQSLTSESESESEEDKQPNKKSPKSKVFKECENSQENKENSEKDNLGRNIKKPQSLSKNSGSENDSDEGSLQKRKTRQQKNNEESETKENGSDKENEMLISSEEKRDKTNAGENSATGLDSDEGSLQKRKTRQQKNNEESDTKENGSDKENELLIDSEEKKDKTNAAENSATEVDRDSDNENETRNTRRSSRKSDCVDDGISKAGAKSEKKDETPSKTINARKLESTKEKESEKEEETSITRRTRNTIKSKEDTDGKQTSENATKPKQNEKNDEDSPNSKDLSILKSKLTIAEKDSDQKVHDESESPKVTCAKRKTRSGSNVSIESIEERPETPTRITRGKGKNSGPETDSPESGKRTLRKRSDSGDSKSCSASPRSNSNILEVKIKKPIKTEEDDEIVFNMPKMLRNKIISEQVSPISSPREDESDGNKVVKRSTRQTDQIKDEATEENKTQLSPNALEISKPEKRKISEVAESAKSAKRIALSPGNPKSTSSESVTSNSLPVKNSNTQGNKKKKLLGPKSQRKNLPADHKSDDDQEEETQTPEESIKKKKLLGPKSRRKNEENLSDNEDDKTSITNAKENLTIVNETECALDTNSSLKQSNSKSEQSSLENERSSIEKNIPSVPNTTLSFIQKKKHSKCDLKLVSLFHHELCKAKCAHCQEVGEYTMHMVHFDMPQKIVSMECQSCNWTTIRRMVITTRVVG